jgi:sortase A
MRIRAKFIEYFERVVSSNFFIKVIAVFFALVLIILIQWGIAREIESNKKQKTIPETTTRQETQKKPIEIREFYLYIPKIGVDAPIIPNVDGNNEDIYNKALESGVAHFQGTGLPGQGSNIFIFGHSSFYPNRPGNYKTVFKKLGNLKIGDEIIVRYNGQDYIYLVNQKKQVKTSDVQYLAPTPSEQLSLMTCWPPGTTKYRLIVIAKPK